MARKDSEKDTERPHYYSQFWLDVAAGRRTIGSSKTGEDAEIMEPDMDMDEPTMARRSNHADGIGYNRYDAAIAHPQVELPSDEDEFEEEEPLDETDEDEPAEVYPDEVEDTDIPNILMDNLEAEANVEAEADEADEINEVPVEEPAPLEEEEEDFFDEEEEEDEWGAGRGRKKPKPGRQTRVPAPKKGKRERRSY
jgi:hypothetical protein